MGPIPARHSPPGPAGLEIRRHTLSPLHSAHDVDLPPKTRMMTWPAVSVKHDHSGDVRASPTHSSRRGPSEAATSLACHRRRASTKRRDRILVARPAASPILLRPRCESPAGTCVCRVRKTRRDKERVRARPMSDVAVAQGDVNHEEVKVPRARQVVWCRAPLAHRATLRRQRLPMNLPFRVRRRAIPLSSSRAY